MDILDLKAVGFSPNLHPNGFVQLRLNEKATRKLHVWPSADIDLPKQKGDQTVHDHVFALRSEVILGSLVNVEMKVDLAPDGPFEIWGQVDKCRRAHDIVKEGKIILEPTGQRAIIKNKNEHTTRAGQVYNFAPFSFHDNYPIGFTATIMEKTEIHPGRARVLIPEGQLPSTEVFEHTVSEEYLWSIIGKSLSMAYRSK